MRVHPENLDRQRLPAEAKGKGIWERRYREINDWERYLTDNGFKVVKLFLNLSKEEQRTRFLKRIDLPEKNWKFSAADVRERGRWDDYQKAFSEMLSATSTSWAPWYVIPADRKWFARDLRGRGPRAHPGRDRSAVPGGERGPAPAAAGRQGASWRPRRPRARPPTRSPPRRPGRRRRRRPTPRPRRRRRPRRRPRPRPRRRRRRRRRPRRRPARRPKPRRRPGRRPGPRPARRPATGSGPVGRTIRASRRGRAGPAAVRPPGAGRPRRPAGQAGPRPMAGPDRRHRHGGASRRHGTAGHGGPELVCALNG